VVWKFKAYYFEFVQRDAALVLSLVRETFSGIAAIPAP
jgi:hypothetical protein